VLRRNDRTHAGARYEIDGNVCFAKGAQDANMRKAARAAAAEHKSNRTTGKPPGKPPEVLLPLRLNMMPPNPAVSQPSARVEQGGACAVKQHQIKPRLRTKVRQQTPKNSQHLRIGRTGRISDDENQIHVLQNPDRRRIELAGAGNHGELAGGAPLSARGFGRKGGVERRTETGQVYIV
jgi:hypothetical protein